METAQAAAKTHYCKFPNCTNEARSSVGRYAYCEEHRDRAARGLDAPTNQPVAASNGTTVAARIAALAADARKVDKAKARAKKLAENALAAKRHADQLQTAFEAKLREQTAA